jgi:TolA-binding protein
VRELALLVATVVTLPGCALKGDVRRVEEQLVGLRNDRAEQARADSARAVLLDEALGDILAIQQRTADSLVAIQRRLTSFQGEVRTDMTEVQRQLVQVQELAGLGQQGVAALRRQIAQRGPGMIPAVDTPTDTVGGPGPSSTDAQEIFRASLDQLNAGGAPQTARMGFQMLVGTYPGDPLVPRAWYFIGETWENVDADSAAVAYLRVVDDYPESRNAPTALYRLGLLAEQKGDLDGARGYFQRVVDDHPRSDEAALARSKLNTPDI